MNNTELKDILKSKHINSWVKIYKDSSEIQNYLFLLYNMRATVDSEIFGLFYLVMNDLSEKPKAYCGADSKFIKYGRGYANFCEKYDRSLKHESCTICHTELYKARNKKAKETNIKVYGNSIPQQTDLVKNKVKETNLARYGYESHNSNQVIKDKKIKTYLERYNVTSPSQIYTKDEKSKKYKNKTGYSHPLCNPEIRYRIQLTNNLKYGGNSPTSSPYVIKKQKETNKLRYGYDSFSKTSEYKKRSKETSYIKYGSEYYSTTEEYRKKVSLTNLERRYKSSSRNKDLIPLFTKFDLQNKKHVDNFQYRCVFCDNIVITPYNSFKKCDCQKLSGDSYQEKDLLEYIKSLIPNTEVLTNIRDVISPKELDIYIPSMNLAFEYNGMYWHNSSSKERNYHQDKVLECKKKGINLIHIFEDEWMREDTVELIKERIRSKLLASNRVFARKCEVREITKDVSNAFVDLHHIQRATSASINLGLYHEDTLVAVMTFSKSRFDKNYQYELIRYCSNGTVVGGAGKLLKYFERKYKPDSLMTYADMNWSTGNLYVKIGFTEVGMTAPGYFYYNPKTKERISRQKCQKHKLVKMGYPIDLTESEICCNILGYYKIYDSGNLKYSKRY